MSRILYYLLLKPLSLLPYPMLYVLSDLMYLVMYKVVGYRVKVIRKNIAYAFPEKSIAEHRKIERDFYRHFMDVMLETIKLFSITSKGLRKRNRIVNPELFESWAEKHPRIIVCSGHFGNWEVPVQLFSLECVYVPIAIYSPLKDRFLDRKLRESRGKFGTVVLPRNDIANAMRKAPARKEAFLWATDQSPSNSRKAYWTTFLNQETPIFLGAEKFATVFDCPVFYMHYAKPKRGCYDITFELVEPSPKNSGYGDITDAHTRILEKEIRKNPHLWLWSHRRWKKVRPPEVPLHPPKNTNTFEPIHSAADLPTYDTQ